MENLHFDRVDFDEQNVNVIVRRGTYFDKLRFDNFFRIYIEEDRVEWGIAKIVDCVVIRFEDIIPNGYHGVNVEKLIEYLTLKYSDFNEKEIVTLIFFTIHYKYKSRNNNNNEI